MDDLKIYCESENDQELMAAFCYDVDPECAICTWEPDPVDTGSWGMFVDNFSESMWDKLIVYLNESPLEYNVEMALETDTVFKQYP